MKEVYCNAHVRGHEINVFQFSKPSCVTDLSPHKRTKISLPELAVLVPVEPVGLPEPQGPSPSQAQENRRERGDATS